MGVLAPLGNPWGALSSSLCTIIITSITHHHHRLAEPLIHSGFFPIEAGNWSHVSGAILLGGFYPVSRPSCNLIPSWVMSFLNRRYRICDLFAPAPSTWPDSLHATFILAAEEQMIVEWRSSISSKPSHPSLYTRNKQECQRSVPGALLCWRPAIETSALDHLRLWVHRVQRLFHITQ